MNVKGFVTHRKKPNNFKILKRIIKRYHELIQETLIKDGVPVYKFTNEQVYIKLAMNYGKSVSEIKKIIIHR